MKSFVTLLLVVATSISVLGGSRSTIALSKIIQEQAKEIRALKNEIAALKQGKATTSATVKRKLSAAGLREVASLNYKIKILDNKVKNYQSKIRNIKYAIIKMTKDDRKGWYYKTAGIRYTKTMSQLPRKWNRRKIRFVYISKAEKHEKIKKEYLKEIAKLEAEKQGLVTKIASVK
jgi:hypothetical protein